MSKSSIDKDLSARTQSNGKKLKKLSKLLNDKPATAEMVPNRKNLEDFAFELNKNTKSVTNLGSNTTLLDFSR